MSSSSPSSDDRSIRLIGSGGHARVVASSAKRIGLALKAVLDTDPTRIGALLGGVAVTADEGQDEGPLHIAIGANAVRRRIAEARPDAVWIAVVDPEARVADDAEVSDGALIGLGACVQTGARIGRHVIVNTGAIVEHDCVVGDFAHIAPGAVLTGDVRIGEGALIGARAVVLPGLTVGDRAVVGAGAVVTRSVEAGVTVAGCPARVVPERT